MLEATRLGVQGVVLKKMMLFFLVQCVRKVHACEQWLMLCALETMLRHQVGMRDVMVVRLEIMRLAAKGLRNKSIADTLSISPGTVRLTCTT